MIDVPNQRFDRPVAAPGIFVHGAEAQDIQVGPFGAARVAWPRATGYRRGFFRVAGDDDRLRFARSSIRKIEGKAPGEQLIENDAQGINIGLDSGLFHANLLGRRVGGRHEAGAGARLIGRRVQILKLLGDAEV